jgi:putative peptidoglycan lipid II flippase
MFKEKYRYRFTLSFRDPKVLKVARLFGPGALVAATVQVNVFVNSIFASMGSGWLSWINQAFRLVHLPVGLVGVAVSVATLPALSRSTAAGDKDGFRNTFSYAIRLVILFTVPAMVGLIILAQPIVRLIYERGQFSSHDSEQVAGALVFFTLGLASYALVKIVTDGFYAIQDLRAPLVVSLLSMFSNVVLNYVFISIVGLDHRGLALATSCTITISFIVLWFLLRRRSGMKGLGGRSATIMLVKMIVASAVMGAFTVLVSRGVDQWLGHASTLSRLLQVGASITVALVVLYITCRLLRVREMDEALSAVLPAGFGWR